MSLYGQWLLADTLSVHFLKCFLFCCMPSYDRWVNKTRKPRLRSSSKINIAYRVWKTVFRNLKILDKNSPIHYPAADGPIWPTHFQRRQLCSSSDPNAEHTRYLWDRDHCPLWSDAVSVPLKPLDPAWRLDGVNSCSFECHLQCPASLE